MRFLTYHENFILSDRLSEPPLSNSYNTFFYSKISNFILENFRLKLISYMWRLRLAYFCHDALLQYYIYKFIGTVDIHPTSKILTVEIFRLYGRLSRISGMEWWNGTLEWNTGMG